MKKNPRWGGDRILHNGLITTITTENIVLHAGERMTIHARPSMVGSSTLQSMRGTIYLLIELDI